MNIAVISPHASGSGVTTVACLLAQELASRNRTVCVTHAAASSDTLYPYLGLSGVNDMGTKMAQMLALVRAGAVKESDVANYCTTVSPRLQAFSLDTKEQGEEDSLDMMRFILTRFTHDFVVVDSDIPELSHPVNQEIIKYSDCVVYVLTQRTRDAKKFRASSQMILNRIGDVPLVVVVNQYCDITCSIKELAAKIGTKNPGRWMTIRYNPWIPYGTENGVLPFLRSEMEKKDYRVVDILADTRELADAVLRVRKANAELEQIRRTRAREKKEAVEKQKIYEKETQKEKARDEWKKGALHSGTHLLGKEGSA